MTLLRLTATAAAAAISLASPAFAEGDAEAGAKTFKKCTACHMVANGDEVLVKGGKTGPNLYGIIGKTMGSQEGFKYGSGLAAAAEQGLTWDEESLVAYVQDPKAYIQEATGDSKAKSKMTFKLKKGGEDVAAFLNSLADGAS
ncbi:MULTISPECIES: c-type cytochrome [Halocynthiibacter]|uniref:C-type cytochrome n=1 Tax=Halocynthiibacter halioticoli TaxID=2986804 RepID=A0AAE3LPX0_9RHOB|nr:MULTISPECIES: c-type cytochrome [Halocynthiibacter]MCV6823887.1 c-type cytochrome [Halocynthiibacter halioticoli]MCW4056888.1 c-type cytochrome [Halocynthiibacter sp. SDUM655004]